MMINTVTLNPGIDYYIFPEQFEAGKINSYGDCSLSPGGKGVNVSLLLTSLNMENTALGIGAGFSGLEIVRLLEQAGCRTDFLFLESGHSRINFQIRLPDGQETAINGRGPEIPLEKLDQLGRRISELKSGDGLVLAGSVPASLPPDSYARLLKKVEGKDLLTVVDAAGEALLAVLPCRPFLIKPNAEELGELFGVEVKDTATAKELAGELQKKGARNVAVSMGSRGALLACEDGRNLFCQTARGEALSTVGAGDSLVAGFLYGWQLHGTLEGALRWGVSAGAATAFSLGIASGDKVREMYLRVGNVHLI